MSLETTLTPLNGAEIRKILKRDLNEVIDKIPLLKEGNAFKQTELFYSFRMNCYPTDCPTPTSEWQELIGLKEGDDVEFDNEKKKLELMEEKRGILIDNLERIEKFLNKHRPVVEHEGIIKDNGTPDETRLNYSLPIPMIQTGKSGRKEVSIKAEEFTR